MTPSGEPATEEPCHNGRGVVDGQQQENERLPQLTSFRRRSYHMITATTEQTEAKAHNLSCRWASSDQDKLSRSDLSSLLAGGRAASSKHFHIVNMDKNNENNDNNSTTAFPTTSHRRNVNGTHTVVAFINSGSGGGKGRLIYKDLVETLGADCVFDLKACSQGTMPQDHLLAFARDPLVRVLACGGDGTMGWIESAIDKVWQQILDNDVAVQDTPYANHLPLALMPLGTGNDLSRSFGWGATFKDKMRRSQYVAKIATAVPSLLDRWRCVILPDCKLDATARSWVPNMLAECTTTSKSTFESLFEQPITTKQNATNLTTSSANTNSIDAEKQVFDGVFCNYLSIGFDAQIAFSFHKERQKHPERFDSTIKNKLAYIKKSTKALQAPLLHDKIKLLVAASDGTLQPLPIPSHCRSIMLLNIQSYAGGNRLSRTGQPDDWLIEVLFLSGVVRMATAAVTPLKIQIAAQTNHVCFRTNQPLHFQVDGEPWLQSKGFVQITHYSQNALLKKVPKKRALSTSTASNWSCTSRKQSVAE
jgi:diacylglycerol kinase (ATP)